jgi:hypothetical protein
MSISDGMVIFLKQTRGNDAFNYRFVDEASIRVITMRLPSKVTLMLILALEIEISVTNVRVVGLKQSRCNDVLSKRLVIIASTSVTTTTRLRYNMVLMLLFTLDIEWRYRQL